MLIVFDAGNSNIVVGIYREKVCIANVRLLTRDNETYDEYGLQLIHFLEKNQIKISEITEATIASVVPKVTENLVQMCEKYLHLSPLVVNYTLLTDITIAYDDPSKLGVDRLVNIVAGVEKYSVPLIIVDFGTATTFCVIDDTCTYRGGAITAGVGISLDALVEKTAVLPKVSLSIPKNCIATNTEEGMQSGLLYGYGALTDGMIQRMEKELGEKATVVATGGFATLINECSSMIDIVDSSLTLEGLRIITEKNRK